MFIRKYEFKWVVDMDLSKCFDTLDHEIIIESVRKRVTDGSILNLVRMFLTSGVMENGSWQSSTEGSPQGVISPLIANIYIDAFDQFMMKRGHRIVRYADDILILKRTKKGAENACETATDYLEGTLKLTVNQKKTHIIHSYKGVAFLGVVIHTGYTRIKEDKKKVKGQAAETVEETLPITPSLEAAWIQRGVQKHQNELLSQCSKSVGQLLTS
jgi:hypothetical protein